MNNIETWEMKFNNIRNFDDLINLSYFEALSYFENLPLHCGGIKNTAELLFNANVNGNSKILEIGCGTGATTNSLLNIDLEVSVVEPSLKLLRTTLRNCKKKSGLTPKYYYNVTAEDMDMIYSNTYDVVILECVFGFIKNKSQAIEQIIRVLKPNGVIAITDFSYNNAPSDKIQHELSNILGINEILFNQNWINYFKNTELVHWSEIPISSNPLSNEQIKTLLKQSDSYEKFPFGDIGIQKFSEKLLEWNNIFAENKIHMSGFNGIWRKKT